MQGLYHQLYNIPQNPILVIKAYIRFMIWGIVCQVCRKPLIPKP